MSEYSVKDKTAIAGIGETAIRQARRGAGQRIPARAAKRFNARRRRRNYRSTDIDGFASFANDRNDSPPASPTALGL